MCFTFTFIVVVHFQMDFLLSRLLMLWFPITLSLSISLSLSLALPHPGLFCLSVCLFPFVICIFTHCFTSLIHSLPPCSLAYQNYFRSKNFMIFFQCLCLFCCRCRFFFLSLLSLQTNSFAHGWAFEILFQFHENNILIFFLSFSFSLSLSSLLWLFVLLMAVVFSPHKYQWNVVRARMVYLMWQIRIGMAHSNCQPKKTNYNCMCSVCIN